MRVSEIRVKQIRVNQGLGVLLICILRVGAVNFIQERQPGHCRAITACTMYITSS